MFSALPTRSTEGLPLRHDTIAADYRTPGEDLAAMFAEEQIAHWSLKLRVDEDEAARGFAYELGVDEEKLF